MLKCKIKYCKSAETGLNLISNSILKSFKPIQLYVPSGLLAQLYYSHWTLM
jgi:hypothetical protein